MHSISNRLAFIILYLIIIIFSCFIPKIAANTTMVIFGFAFMGLLLIFVIFLTIRFKVYGYLKFTDELLIQGGFLCRYKEYNYRDYTATIGNYTSIVENKKAFIFLKKGGPIINVIDTSKYGNVGQVNKHEILYCMYSVGLHNLVRNIYNEKLSNVDIYAEAVERIHKKISENTSLKYKLAKLSLPERILYVLDEFDSEIQNGGINQYFINSSRMNAHLVSGYLEKINALDQKLLFDEFVYNCQIDFDNLDNLGELDDEVCDQFDEYYYDLNSLMDLLIEFIKNYNL